MTEAMLTLSLGIGYHPFLGRQLSYWIQEAQFDATIIPGLQRTTTRKTFKMLCNSQQSISWSFGAGSVLWILPRVTVLGWVSKSLTVNPLQHPDLLRSLGTLPYSAPGNSHSLALFNIDMFGPRAQSTQQTNEKLNPCAYDSLLTELKPMVGDFPTEILT